MTEFTIPLKRAEMAGTTDSACFDQQRREKGGGRRRGRGEERRGEEYYLRDHPQFSYT